MPRRQPPGPPPPSDLHERCWLCERPLGRRIERHHPVPKSRGGRITRPVHPICHRALHVGLDNKELAAIGEDVDRLRRHAALRPFLDWIAGKPPDFHASTRRARRRP